MTDERKKSGRSAEDLAGRRFGRLTVIRKAETQNNRTRWFCRCDCGEEKIVTSRDLKSGKVKSCGCLRRDVSGKNKKDISGRRFGRLTALYPTMNRDRHGAVCWMCRCDCGNLTEVAIPNLLSGSCKSCGCLKKENQEKIQSRLHHIDGTCVEFLEKRKKRRDNKSGFRGVYQIKNGKYRVNIGFQGKRIYLGVYEIFDDAVEARLNAEKELYGEFLERYHEWEKQSSKNPEWAREHPFEMAISDKWETGDKKIW